MPVCGEWTLTDPAAGRRIVPHFNSEQVEMCYFNWNGPQKRANLELWPASSELGPGESLTMEHEYVFMRTDGS